MSKRSRLPARAILNAWFEYHENGVLTARHDLEGTNRRKGEQIGYLSDDGYLRCRLGGAQHYVHRIVYKMHFDMEPEYVDHINREKTDNRIENLRPATNAENMQNRKPKYRYKGVTPKKDGTFVANITVDGFAMYLGRYEVEEEAARAYDAAAREYREGLDFATLNFPTVEEML